MQGENLVEENTFLNEEIRRLRSEMSSLNAGSTKQGEAAVGPGSEQPNTEQYDTAEEIDDDDDDDDEEDAHSGAEQNGPWEGSDEGQEKSEYSDDESDSPSDEDVNDTESVRSEQNMAVEQPISAQGSLAASPVGGTKAEEVERPMGQPVQCESGDEAVTPCASREQCAQGTPGSMATPVENGCPARPRAGLSERKQPNVQPTSNPAKPLRKTIKTHAAECGAEQHDVQAPECKQQ